MYWRCRPDLDSVEALNPEREALWARLDAASFLTEDEKRAAAGYGASSIAFGNSPSSSRPPNAVTPEARKYSPDQPRVPAGSSDGGQWTDGGGGSFADIDRGDDIGASGAAQIAQNNRGRGTVSLRAGGQTFEATPAQVMRLSNATNASNGAVARVREIDPNWRPSPSAYESAEGAIRAREAEAAEALVRFETLRGDAIPKTNPSWGVNRLRKELNDQGYIFEKPTRSPGLLYRNPETGEEVRIMDRPRQRYSTDTDQKHNNDYYYRYRPGRGKQEGTHITIPNKGRSDK